MIRPDVTLFGAARYSWQDGEQARGVTVGHRNVGSYYPAAEIPMLCEAGALIVEVNIESTPHSSFADISLTGDASMCFLVWWTNVRNVTIKLRFNIHFG